MTIGGALRTARTARGKSLTYVAGAAGISAATLSRIETGKQGVDVRLLKAIADILGISASELLRDDDERSETDGGLVRALATRSAGERARIIAEAGRQDAPRTERDLAQQFEALLATLDIIREELTELQQQAKKRRR